MGTQEKNVAAETIKSDGAVENENRAQKKKGRRRSRAPDGKKPVRKRKKLTLKQRVINLVFKIGIIAALIWFLLTFVGGVFIVHTSDMYPALRDGDLEITFKLGQYKSGDIIAYKYDDTTCFGRIVGEPGDEIIIDEDGTYTVNGIRPYETIFYDTTLRASDSWTFPYTIQSDEYFVLADAREQGFDSRDTGPVTEPLGKVVLMLRRRGF